jgi:hypothetical protein
MIARVRKIRDRGQVCEVAIRSGHEFSSRRDEIFMDLYCPKIFSPLGSEDGHFREVMFSLIMHGAINISLLRSEGDREARSAAMQFPRPSGRGKRFNKGIEARRADIARASCRSFGPHQSFSNLYPRPYGRGYSMTALRASPYVSLPFHGRKLRRAGGVYFCVPFLNVNAFHQQPNGHYQSTRKHQHQQHV